MSYDHVARAIELQTFGGGRIDGTLKLLLVVIAHEAYRDGWTKPRSVEFFAKLAGISLRTAERIMPRLIELGVIDREERHMQHSRFFVRGLIPGQQELPLDRQNGGPKLASGTDKMAERDRQFGGLEPTKWRSGTANLADIYMESSIDKEDSRDSRSHGTDKMSVPEQGDLIDDLVDPPDPVPLESSTRRRRPANGHHREAKQPGARHHPCPDDYQPGDQAALYCTTHGLPLEPTVRAFVTYWTSEKQSKTRRPGWDRSFMNWVDNQLRFDRKPNGNGGHVNGDKPAWLVEKENKRAEVRKMLEEEEAKWRERDRLEGLAK
jgi:hypothetical protein